MVLPGFPGRLILQFAGLEEAKNPSEEKSSA